MPQRRKTPYVSVNLTVPARDAVQGEALDVSAQVRRRVPLSEVVLAAIAVARQHPDEFLKQFTSPTPSSDQEESSQ